MELPDEYLSTITTALETRIKWLEEKFGKLPASNPYTRKEIIKAKSVLDAIRNKES